ncbi:hypothetical protein [Saccharomonospora cyanea]|uniref:Uncharacterized protein n=1 Tax=Saccharomonospora cyanea NA-134 TaxID=882082 RepID=H5XJ19_9PSEU|nr:hypothetical protein [Saccharomonospora cyanea]EHR61795.1 hypothetical protein SaccyDRAFT_2952 [Saccharomonospora cyanea NA-134]
MCCPSATLAVWSSAWLSGAAASDDVLDALGAWGEAHEVVAHDEATAEVFDVPVSGEVPAPPARLLGALRRLGTTDGRLVLPVAGDVRGLGAGGPFASAALRAGEALVFADLGFGVVPQHVAEGLWRWTVFTLTGHPLSGTPAPEYVPLGEAEHGLTEAVRESAGTLRALDVARDRPGVRAELSARLRSRPRPEWPPGMPGRALRVLQRAEEIGAILGLAQADEPGGAVSASAAARRAEALRPLGDAVRRARCAAVNEAVRLFARTSETS